MAKNREGSINLFGAVQAKTEDGIVVHADGIAVEYDENGNPTKTLEQAIADGSLGGENSLEVIDVEELPSATIDTSTVVPSSGMVGKVYFNTKLSVEEVNAILETLEYTTNTDLYPIPFIAVAMDSNMQNGLMCARGVNDGVYNYAIAVVVNGEGNIAYTYDTTTGETKGWILSEIDLNIDNMLSVLAPQVGMTIQNSALKNLISITPFEEPNPDIELDKLYRTPIKEGGEWSGTAVPNTGTVEKVYINTKLSSEEYYKILNNLTWLDSSIIGQSGFEFYPALAYMSSSAPYVVGFMKYSENNIHFGLLNFATMGTIQNFFIGEWETFENPYPIGFETLSELSGISIGTQNDLIKSMFSTTPFVKINEEIVGYKYNQFVNGKWHDFDNSNKMPVVIKLPEIISDDVNIDYSLIGQHITDEIWDMFDKNKIVYLNIPITFASVLKFEMLCVKIVNIRTAQSNALNSVIFEAVDMTNTFTITKSDTGYSSFYNVSAAPIVEAYQEDTDTSISLKVRKSNSFTYNALVIGKAIWGKSITAEETGLLVTGKAVYEFVTNYMSTNYGNGNEEKF